MADDVLVLVVDDEESVRRTFLEWLRGANLGCEIRVAADAEESLRLANEAPIDLAILDWNLGAGDDGLQLLTDLSVFHPDIVAILVTGYANQATPLDAMRMGVRDYLDKNHDLDRDTFLKAVRKQLDLIRPAKRARLLHQSLVGFRETFGKILPLVQSASALTDPVPLPDAIHGLVRLVLQITQAEDGVLLVRHYDAQRTPAEIVKVYSASGDAIEAATVPFARSLAGSAVGQQDACVMNDMTQAAGFVDLQPFETNRRNVLALPMTVAPGVHAVLELFDKRSGDFSPEDQSLAKSAADLGAELLRQALGLRHQHQMLLDAVGAALMASESMSESLSAGGAAPAQVMDQLRQGLQGTESDPAAAEASLQLAEAIRLIARKHGPVALEHCLKLVDQVRGLLDEFAG